MSTHTPGPWIWCPEESCFRALVDGNGDPCEREDAELVFSLGDDAIAADVEAGSIKWTDFFPSEADARLIAAAPELLAALRDVVGYAVTEVTFCAGRKCREPHCCDCNGEEYAEGYVSRAAESIASARVAIAKAEDAA